MLCLYISSRLLLAGCIKILEDVPSAVFKIGDLLAVIMERKGDQSRTDTIARIVPLVCNISLLHYGHSLGKMRAKLFKPNWFKQLVVRALYCDSIILRQI